MVRANHPIKFSGETILAAAYILNQVRSKSVPKIMSYGLARNLSWKVFAFRIVQYIFTILTISIEN